MLRIVLVVLIAAVVGCGKKGDSGAATGDSPSEGAPTVAGKDGPAKPAVTLPTPWKVSDDVAVRVDEAVVRKVMILGGFEREKETGPVTVVKVSIANRSPTRKVDYSWWGHGISGADLEDEHGNRYKSALMLGHRVAGEMDNDKRTIYPGDEPRADLIIFERPVATAFRLKLTLEAKNVGGKGKYVFEFPAPQQKK